MVSLNKLLEKRQGVQGNDPLLVDGAYGPKGLPHLPNLPIWRTQSGKVFRMVFLDLGERAYPWRSPPLTSGVARNLAQKLNQMHKVWAQAAGIDQLPLSAKTRESGESGMLIVEVSYSSKLDKRKERKVSEEVAMLLIHGGITGEAKPQLAIAAEADFDLDGEEADLPLGATMARNELGGEPLGPQADNGSIGEQGGGAEA